jgi:cysteine-rich repeat protein
MRTLSPLVLFCAAMLAACGDNAATHKPGSGSDQEDCMTAGDEDGNGLADCKDPACASTAVCTPTASGCGDGKLEAGEVCDDGNALDGDGCDNNCTISACGNGVATAGEACDDGNAVDGDGCDHNCTVTACGNGVVTAGEVCDDGNLIDGDGCDHGCTVTGCGNGVMTAGEACDDGNLVDGDGCDRNCTVTACGNGIATTGEACDDGNNANWDTCSNTCTQTAFTYVKASNTGAGDAAGTSVAISADGSTLAVGAEFEQSAATGVGGNDADNTADASGAVYVYTRSGATWVQQAYIKASNTAANDHFGISVALSADGSTLAVGASGEDSASGTDQTSNAALDSGAVYVFARTGTVWAQQAYVKASNPGASDKFGGSVALSGDGATLAVGAVSEDSAATGINGNPADGVALDAGAAYVFARTGTTWAQQAYVKASNTEAGDNFGDSVALSGDGATLAVGAIGEDSATAADPADNTALSAGAAYVFTRTDTTWSQQAYLKASGALASDAFGTSVTLSSDGATLVAGADDVAAGNILFAGAAYVFTRTAGTWSQAAKLQALHASTAAAFGQSLSLSADGKRLAVGAVGESSKATGVGGDATDTTAVFSGAAYVFVRGSTTWAQQSYVKASNTGASDFFGNGVALSGDGGILAVGAPNEDSAATGIGGDQTSNTAGLSGAVYVFQ